MDDSWQLRGMNRPPSQWVNWQGPTNQVDMGPVRYPNPYITQEICVIERTVRQDPSFPNMFSLNSQSSHSRAGKPHTPHPMLAITQENLQQFHADYQQTAISRTSYLASNQPWHSTNPSEMGGWPLLAPGNPSLMGKLGAPASATVLPEFFQSVHGGDMNLLSRTGGSGAGISRSGSMEIYKQPLSVNSHLAELDLQPHYQAPIWQSENRSSMYVEKHAPLLQKSASQPIVDSPSGLIREQSHTKPLLRPRVLCAGVSGLLLGGELTMSEAGRLGVICSCHGLHMSVAKFSEHAGLFAVDPGSSVLLEGGESMAQWRKSFFSQFGVKVPEDHVGWDWDERNGAEGDGLPQREVHAQSIPKQADAYLQGDCTSLKNNVSMHSAMGLGLSNVSRSRTAGLGIIHANPSQDPGTIESTVPEKSYKGFAGVDFSENQAVAQKRFDFTNKNQGSNSTHLFWGNEVAASSVTDHASFSKVGGQSSKHVMENSSAFSGTNFKKVMEICSGRYSAQELEQVENDLATSNFELRLGQPSQQNLSLGSIYSSSLQSRGSSGPISQSKVATYEMASQSAWEQTCNQSVDCSVMGRPATFGGVMGQGNEGTYTANWFSNNQKNRNFGVPQVGQENDKQLGFHQMHARTFADAHTLQIFPSMRKHPEDTDMPYVEGSYHSDVMMQPSDNRGSGEQRRAELSSSDYSTFTTLNALQNDSFKEAGTDPQCHQSSALLIRPTVKTLEGVRNIEGMFMSPIERPRPVMGPPETMASATQSSAMKNTIMQTAGARSGACESPLTSWAKQVSCLTISESLSSCGPSKLQERTSSTMVCPAGDATDVQQGLLVQAENHLAEQAGPSVLGSSMINTSSNLVCTREGPRDYENQAFHQQINSSRSCQDMELVNTNPLGLCTDSGLKIRNEHKSVTHGGSLVVGERSASDPPEEIHNGNTLDKTHPGMLATRASVQDSKSKEVFSDPMVTNCSSSDKCCLSDEEMAKSDVDAEADSDGVAITTQEASLPFKSPDRLDKPSLDGDSAKVNLEEKRSSRHLCGTAECTAKELVRNDLVDEGSGIGKCCSSIEADMEAMTSAGPVSSHAYVQVLESQTSMANSSSSNAVISDTLSNSVRVRKLFMEVDKNTTAAQAEAQYGAVKSIHRIDKRGRKTLKMKSLDVSSFPQGEGKERFSRVEDKGPMSVSRKTPVTDDTSWVPTAKGLKRKRSALNSGPDPTCSKVTTFFGEGTSRGFDEEEHALKRKGLKVVLRPPEATFGKQTIDTNLFSNEKLCGKVRRAKFPEFNSTFTKNAYSSMKPSMPSGKEKSKSTTISVKNGRGIVDRQAVKMASLSSILEVPKARTGSHRKRVADSNGDMMLNPPQPNISQSRFRQMKGWPVGGAPNMLARPNGGVDDRSLTKPEGHRQSSWEMAARLISRATGTSVGASADCKPTGVGLRSTQKIAQMYDFKGKMVTVPLKFIAAKRLEPEVLRKETKSLSLSSVDHNNLSSGPVKRSRSQVTHAKTVLYNHVSHIESGGLVSNDEEDEVKPVRKRRKRRQRSRSTVKSNIKPSMVCCICGESSIQSNNTIVKCSQCALGVHQACYGVTEVSKTPWTCRPCKAQATNIVCVLCGYGGGAMTRAKKSGVLAKGLLQAWQTKKEADRFIFNHYTAVDSDRSHCNPCPCDCRNGQTNYKVHDVLKKDEGGLGRLQEDCNVLRNSVTDGVNDPTVAQWLHVVCALWMPGTRCTNVETMAAFDVSGVGSAPRKWVCSICKRAGGACIKCRVAKCATPFHPWCAHGKGLLQNEAFGGEEEKVGFFGKCLFHGNLAEACVAEAPIMELAAEAPIIETAAAESQNDNSTCARTEGGYKRGEKAFGKKVIDPTTLGILQEDVTAWLSIKEHKRSNRRFIKLANSDVRTHYREYVRYKQGQSWKRLAVYKSSIHALGLYTSENIAKGEMVVEYVGEIVGLRVADKREVAYLSNGRLQYRGACYLFRIDKEHIVDATRKGGIARFVNHSCSPNCVAKIISVEKQKKVVFFAEKDIGAGEELTYDYKLDFETENRIPCFCKSPECRGFLN